MVDAQACWPRPVLVRTCDVIVAAHVAAGLLAAPWPVSAQSPAPYEMVTEREIILSAAGSTLLLAGYAIGNDQEPLSAADIEALDPADINAFDRPATHHWSPGAATASDVLTWSLLASPMILAAAELETRNTGTLAVMYLETLLIKNGVVQILKGTTNRIRPLAYNHDPTVAEAEKLKVSTRRSFPSGHTANAFAAAVFLSSAFSKLHPESRARTWVWVGSLTAAGTVGFLRYGSGRHFPSDVVAGALIGSCIGYLVPKLHETNAVYSAPTVDGLELGLVVRF